MVGSGGSGMCKTALVLVNKSDSLHVSVPGSVVKLLCLRQSDQAEWIVVPDGNGFAASAAFVEPKPARTKARANQSPREPKLVRAPRASRR